MAISDFKRIVCDMKTGEWVTYDHAGTVLNEVFEKVDLWIQTDSGVSENIGPNSISFGREHKEK